MCGEEHSQASQTEGHHIRGREAPRLISWTETFSLRTFHVNLEPGASLLSCVVTVNRLDFCLITDSDGVFKSVKCSLKSSASRGAPPSVSAAAAEAVVVSAGSSTD